MSGISSWQFFKTKLKVEEDSRPRSMDNSGKVSEKSYRLLSHFPVLVGKEILVTIITSYQ